MGQRLSLQTVLETLNGTEPGEKIKVYFQPTVTSQMEYPCIVYKRDYVSTQYADDNPYRIDVRYQVTVIDRNPDSEIPLKVARLPKSTFDRAFQSAGLNHDVYNLYY